MRLASALVLLAACTPELADGVYGCPDGICPEGFYCGSDMLCRRGAAPTVECVVDGHCDDELPCTADSCRDGRCAHEPVAAECDDGDFCNGRDECIDGVCVNPPESPPPCPMCDPMAPMPCACGPGNPCCAGDVCFDAVCVSGTCRACGDVGAPCCLGAACPGLAAICDAGTCVHCGAEGELCCAGRCGAGLECDNTNNTCRPPGSCGGTECDPMSQVCFGGTCVLCGPERERCCTGGACADAGIACNFTTMMCEPCGKDMQICCVGDAPPCSDGFACAMGRCEGCGAAVGQPCCPIGARGDRCNADIGLVCTAPIGPGTCVMCGDEGAPCCPGGDCTASGTVDDGLLCVAGLCQRDCGGHLQPCCSMFCIEGYICRAGTCMPI